MDQVRPRLEAFAAQMLGGLARSDQRAKGELYLRGLMLDGKRKSMQPIAARLGVDHQQLQQFVTSSTWDHVEVRKRVASWADELIEPEAYVIDDSGFPKDGSDSPGGGEDVLRNIGEGRELPNRGQRARGHRHRIGGDQLGAVSTIGKASVGVAGYFVAVPGSPRNVSASLRWDWRGPCGNRGAR
jgi:alkylation response protein AidB-like acyl-CoA dehydrogenase